MLLVFDYLAHFPFKGVRQVTIDAWRQLLQIKQNKPPVTNWTTAQINELIATAKKPQKEKLDSLLATQILAIPIEEVVEGDQEVEVEE